LRPAASQNDDGARSLNKPIEEMVETARRMGPRAARGKGVSEICHVVVTNIKQKEPTD
jgi:hypothetical protein